MTSPEEIEKVSSQIRRMQFPRLFVFADVVSRYSETVLKNKVSWLRTNALLFIITRGGSLTPTQLARILLRSNYSVTKLIDGLEKDGLVQRQPNGNDRRSINIKVTSEGLKYVMSNLKQTSVAENDLKKWLPNDELENLAATIRFLRDKFIERVSARYKLSAADKKAIFSKSVLKINDQDL
jgi:DNA-binding MarR family transcriptional regulator